MKDLVHKLGKSVMGVLSGFDRLLFRGTLRAVIDTYGLNGHLYGAGVAMKDFKHYATQTTQKLIEQSLQHAEEIGRPMEYVPSSQESKKDKALQIAQRDGIREGLICVLKCVEPCQTFELKKDRAAKKLVLEKQAGKCLHLYHDYDHADYGLMHVRWQTWFPFMIQICMNGREWLIKQLQHAGIGYQRRDNCVCRVDDVAAAQQLLDAQLRTSWTDLWDDLRRQVHPAHESIFAGCPESLHGYYWTAAETEWASDVLFETTIHRPEEFQVWRTTENDPDGPMAWLKMRRGVADLHRRSEVSRASNARFAAALSAVVDDNPVLLKQIAAALCSRVVRPGREPADGGRTRSRSFRALNPLNPDDIRLLTVVSKAEFVLTGLRNADVRRALYGEDPTDAKERRRRSSAVSRKLALLRAHGLLNKVSKSHDYRVTENGRQALTALLAAANATTHELTKLAA